MTTSFPASLDTFTNPSATDAMNSVTVPHATQHATINDAVAALEAKVGANSSAVTTTHDYKLSGITGLLKALANNASATDILVGRSTAGSGLLEEIACTAAGRAIIAAATALAQRNALGLAAIAASGSASDIVTGVVPATVMPALSGDVTTTSGSISTTIGANKVTRGMLAQGGARTVIGVVGSGTANVADIALSFLGVSASVADVALSSGSTTPAYGQCHRCTGTGADYTVTLPTIASGDAGKCMGFVMDRALTKLVTIARGSTNVIAESLTSLVMWAGESILVRVNAAEDGWDIIDWRRRAMAARMSDLGTVSISSATDTVPNWTATDYDNGGMADLTNNYFVVRRPGNYQASAYIRYASGATAARLIARMDRYPSNHVGGVSFAVCEQECTSTSLLPGMTVTGQKNYAINEICEFVTFQNGAAARNTSIITFSFNELL